MTEKDGAKASIANLFRPEVITQNLVLCSIYICTIELLEDFTRDKPLKYRF
jgi:hypothetical protein